MKLLVSNYSCPQDPWLGATAPRSPFSLSSTEFAEPPPNKIPGYATSNSKMPNFELWHSCCKWAICSRSGRRFLIRRLRCIERLYEGPRYFVHRLSHSFCSVMKPAIMSSCKLSPFYVTDLFGVSLTAGLFGCPWLCVLFDVTSCSQWLVAFIALCQSASVPFAGTPKLLGH
jgi:hypothetical protein